MADMKQLYILRHGQTEWNVERRMQGRYDSPLTATGRQQAIASGKLLRELGGVDHLLVSPSGRTTETAHLVNSHTQVKMDFDEALMERDCGEWSGLLVEEVAERYPELWSTRYDDPYWHTPPGGENMHHMAQRVGSLLDSLSNMPVQRLGLVTHGIMSKVVLKHFLDLKRR